MTSVKKQIYSIDFMKMICTVLVVCIHVRPFLAWDEEVDFFFTQGICRLAVPFFFMCNGYLWTRDNDRGTFEYLKRIFLLYLAWVIVYMPLFTDVWNENDYSAGENIKEFLYQFIFVNVRIHFWYFPAVLCGVFLVWLFRKKMSVKQVVLTGCVLYLIGTLGQAHYWIVKEFPVLEEKFEIYFEVFEHTRNGVFFAFFFIALGKAIQIYELSMRKKNSLIGFALSALLMYREISFVKERDFLDFNMYLSLIPASYFLFQLVKEMNIKWRWVGRELRNGCVIVFCSHVMVDYYLDKNGFLNDGVGYFGLVLGISSMIACLAVCLEKYAGMKWLKILH